LWKKKQRDMIAFAPRKDCLARSENGENEIKRLLVPPSSADD
jgi:hypothetical protein